MICVVILHLVRLELKDEQKTNGVIIELGTTMGKQNKEYEDFISKILENVDNKKLKNVKVFVGPYRELMRFYGGILAHDPYNYYIFIDDGFFIKSQPQVGALLAHELGHIESTPSILEKIELRLWLNLPWRHLYERRNSEISIKYQMEADTFGAENTSPDMIIDLLNQIFPTPKEKNDKEYQIRIANLEDLKRGN